MIQTFNFSLKEGLKKLRLKNLIDESPESLASFIFNNRLVSKEKIGVLLGENKDFNTAIRSCYLLKFDFSNLEVVQGLRLILSAIKLPPETQQIQRILEEYSRVWFEQNKDNTLGARFTNMDGVYMLAFSIMMLQTDLHNPANLNKMKKEDYLRQLKFIEEMVEEGKDQYGSEL